MDNIKAKVLEYFKGDEFAATVWLSKYALKNKEGKTIEESPDVMHRRLAKEFAKIEKNYPATQVLDPVKWNALSHFGRHLDPIDEEYIYDLIKYFEQIVPQGSVMSGLGGDSIISLSNCLRLPPPDDSYGSILFTDNQLVNAAKRRCGYGLGLSKLRPRGAKVTNSAGTSTGAASFMDRYSNSTREVAQEGRRGACLLDIDVMHPDSMEFAESKIDKTKVTGANISVKIYDDFMEALEKDADYILRFPTWVNPDEYISKEDYSNLEYGKLVEVSNAISITLGEKVYLKKIKAKDYWNRFIELARDNAEPGLFYWDRMIDYDPASVYPNLKPDGTNACVVGDTLVFTNIGWIKIKNLEKFRKTGVKVITRDNEGKLFNSDLEWVAITTKEDLLYKICFDNGEFLLTNKKHKFYNENFEEREVSNLQIGEQIVSGCGLVKVANVEGLDRKEDVYDLTAKPNYNFYSILNREEFIVQEEITVNDSIRFKYYDIVNIIEGQKFAFELTENDEII